MSTENEAPFLERFRDTKRNLMRWWLRFWGSGFMCLVVGFGVAYIFIKPAPPRTIVIAVGAEDGAYWQFAKQYAKTFAKYDIELKLRATAGSLENYRLLTSDDEVHVAIVQGGAVPEKIRKENELESIASLYLEPVWVFYRNDVPITQLRELKDRRIAIGRPGSGAQSLARLLLEENGVVTSETTSFVQSGGSEAARRLKAREIDAAFFVTSPQSAVVRDLILQDDVRLLSFDRHQAYSQRHPFLSDVVLHRGVVDLAQDLPAEDEYLIAPAAILVASPDLHDALVPLFLKAVTMTHERGERLLRSGKFPSTDYVEFPLNESARLYFESGPPFLQRYLPFWVAAFVDRAKVLILPAITLLFPLFKIAPPLYRWRIRSRIYRWYEVLRAIESNLKPGTSPETLRLHVDTVGDIERELDDLDSVPLAYMEEFYNLRLHVELVRSRVRRLLEVSGTGEVERTPD